MTVNVEGKRLLIVDDDWAIGDLLEARFAVLGLNTRFAVNGRDAVSYLPTFRPHAMILDINMPSLDGFSLMSRLGLDAMRRLPTLVLTARNRQDDVHRAISLGAKDYLAKPFDEAQLRRRVMRLFR